MGALRLALKIVLLACGALLVLFALAGAVLIFEWLRHPGGIGMEWIVVPIVGLIALSLLAGGAVLIRLALRKRPLGEAASEIRS